MAAAEEQGMPADVQEKKPPGRERLHYIDWMRLLMVLGVIFAHTTKSGITGTGGLNMSWMIDDRTLWDYAGYRELFPDRTGPNPYEGRWVSVVRPWCLPLLFWVSGAAVACAYKGGRPKGAIKLFAVTLIGMASNALLWYMGPLDDRCYVGLPSCKDKGILFNFTIVLWAGTAFAILFQMWYTVVLVVLQYLNWPLLGVFAGSFRPWALGIQWALNVVLYMLMVLGSGASGSTLLCVLLPSALLEAAFLAVAWVCSAHPHPSVPQWVSVRACHYALAAVSVAQFAALPYAESMDAINLSYLAYIVTGFNRFFDLGFIMIRARRDPKGDQASPLASKAWPLVLIVWTITSPSTNWDVAGLLTYPFFRRAVDRCLYVTCAMVVVFTLDRASRGVKCEEMPAFAQNAGLFLYVFHPWLVTIMIALGVRSVGLVVILAIAAGFSIVGGITLASRWLSSRRRPSPGSAAVGDESSSDSDDSSNGSA